MNTPEEIGNKSFRSSQLTGSPRRKSNTLGAKFPTPTAKLELGSQGSPVGESPAFAPRIAKTQLRFKTENTPTSRNDRIAKTSS